MDVLIVRHAHAGDSDPRRWPDDGERPLSEKGVRDFRCAAAALGRLAGSVDAVWSSPLVRAWQTAEILTQEAKWPKAVRTSELVPGLRPAVIVKALGAEDAASRVALVGHEPDLSMLVAYLVTGDEHRAVVEMKKGAAALLRFDGKPGAGRATLVWLLPPRAFASA